MELEALIYQSVKANGLPPGTNIQIPAANGPTVVAASGEVFVKNSIAAVIPAANCSALLAPIVGGQNDLAMNSVTKNMTKFLQLSQIPCSNYNPQQFSSSYQPTKAIYTGAAYFFFGQANLGTTGLCFTSTPDLDVFSEYTNVPAVANSLIVDVYYSAGLFYFLAFDGTIYVLADPSSMDGVLTYSLPANPQGYRSIALINANWYVVGSCRTTNAGPIVCVSAGANLASFSIVYEATTNGLPTAICQGSGVGASTEVLVSLSTDAFLKSTTNGGAFTLVATATGIATNIIKRCFYSARTGKYYLAAANTADEAIRMYVSSLGTLTGSTWTAFLVGTGETGAALSHPITIHDTGTWVGLTSTMNTKIYNFFTGASYNTAGAIITSAERATINDASYLQSAISYWLNNKLVTIYGSSNSIAMLITSDGTTGASNVSKKLFFPWGFYNPTYTCYSFSGFTYLAGVWYAMLGSTVTAAAAMTSYAGFLYKFNAALTGMSCPVAPVIQTGLGSLTQSQMSITAGAMNSAGTGIVWGVSNISPVTSAPVFHFNGAALVSSALTTAQTGTGNTNSGGSDSYNPAAAFASVKWSGIFGKYLSVLPATANDANGTQSAQLGSTSTLTGALTMIYAASQGAANYAAVIGSWDLTSDGMAVVYSSRNDGITQNQYVKLCTPSGNYDLDSGASGGANTQISNFATWEVITGGSKYLVMVTQKGVNYTLNIWKLSTTLAPFKMVANMVITSYGLSLPTCKLMKRVVSYGGSFYLGDLVGGLANRNSLKLTFSGMSVAIAAAYLHYPGDYSAAGLADNYSSSRETITTVNPTPVPSVYLPPAAAGSYTKIK